MKPKVSVICTVYKHEPYLRQCFDGFVMQKTNFPIEVLVNDDCSPDGSAAIMREYEAKYPDLFRCVYQKENQYSKGLLPWFEVLFPMTKGEYIAICEGDDYWTDPYKLQKQVDWMDAHPDYIACFHNAYTQCGNKRGLFNSLTETHYPTTEDIIQRRWFISTQTLFYRNVLKEYPEWRKGVKNEDYMLELLLAQRGKFYYMEDVMAVYRVEGQGVSVEMNADKMKMFEGLIALLTNMKVWYGGDYAEAFDNSIANYQHQKKNYKKELYYSMHPFARALRLKTYTRAMKKWLRKIVNR